ncbi:MAG: nuclear transport factor 2 family protein [Rhodobiaceae bacterium]|nr:nuclear transport factor 2 family protein [Rhodobiaceae bacterium]
MSDTERNTETARAAYAAWGNSKGTSIDHWLSIMDDDIRSTSLADEHDGFDLAQARVGKAEVRAYLQALSDNLDFIDFRTENIIAQGDWVVVLSTVAFRGRATGKVYRGPKADILRFRDGKLVEVREFYDTAAARDLVTMDD